MPTRVLLCPIHLTSSKFNQARWHVGEQISFFMAPGGGANGWGGVLMGAGGWGGVGRGVAGGTATPPPALGEAGWRRGGLREWSWAGAVPWREVG